MAHNEDLEARIVENPEDDATWLVYGDWLASQGDPRGELVAVQHALEAALGADDALERRQVEILARHGVEILGALPEDVALVWRRGFLREIAVGPVDLFGRPRTTGRAVEAAVELLGRDAARLLDELAVNVLTEEIVDGEALSAVLEALRGAPAARRLRALRIGEVDNVDLAHYPIGAVGETLAALPRLERLQLRGSEIDPGGPLRMPRLRVLSLKTCSLTTGQLGAILDGELPALERLVLWFGSEDYGCDLGPDHLQPLLSGDRLPRLRHLALANAEFTDDLIAPLLASPLLARLETLDLSLGTLSDEGAARLRAGAARLGHLRELDLSENFLSEAGEVAVAGLCAHVDAADQKEAWGDEPDGGRYVSFSE